MAGILAWLAGRRHARRARARARHGEALDVVLRTAHQQDGPRHGLRPPPGQDA